MQNCEEDGGDGGLGVVEEAVAGVVYIHRRITAGIIRYTWSSTTTFIMNGKLRKIDYEFLADTAETIGQIAFIQSMLSKFIG